MDALLFSLCRCFDIEMFVLCAHATRTSTIENENRSFTFLFSKLLHGQHHITIIITIIIFNVSINLSCTHLFIYLPLLFSISPFPEHTLISVFIIRQMFIETMVSLYPVFLFAVAAAAAITTDAVAAAVVQYLFAFATLLAFLRVVYRFQLHSNCYYCIWLIKSISLFDGLIRMLFLVIVIVSHSRRW